ncbi:MAG: AraC family transcriptional regulator [Nocardioidaceae bacterium]
MDPLTEVLHDVRLADCFYCRSELSAPWGLEIPARDCASFHFVAEGAAWLNAGNERLPLRAGDLVVLPHGGGHRLGSAPDAAARPIHELPHEKLGASAALLRHGGGGEPALLLCGGVRFDAGDDALVALLPDVLHVRADAGDAERCLAATLTAMGIEAARPRPGSETVITRLADVLVIHALRSWLETSREARAGWLGALRDEQIGRALALMHRHPERRWTVASLAATVHMSRAAFAQRFTELVGVAPMTYLTRRRMRLATGWIRDGELAPGEVAPRLGYGSVAAFSRAFKRHVGVAPGSVRQRAA